MLNSVRNFQAIPANENRYLYHLKYCPSMSLFLGSEMCYLSPYLNYLILNDIAKVNFNTNYYSSMYYPCYRHVFIPGLYDYARITPQISQTASNVALLWRSMYTGTAKWSQKSNLNTWL